MSPDPRDLYPLSEKAPTRVVTPNGVSLADFTVDAVLEGRIAPSDLAISPEVLRLQAHVSRAAGKDRLAESFLLAAELTAVPQELLLSSYELLRPGRAQSGDDLRERARLLRENYAAPRVAALIEEAADVYARRGLFTKRF